MFFTIKDAFYAVWIERNQYIAALRIEPYRDGMLLEALETSQKNRRQGYATKLLSAVLPVIKNIGYEKLYAHVSKEKAASLRVHEKCGFNIKSDNAVLIDGSVTDDCCTLLRD